jgi:methylmalonyl-CoA mutase C-terminal domain/subunit
VEDRKLRVMVAKPGLDGHDRGARIIARAFRDAGFEVVYTGLHQTPESIVLAALPDDDIPRLKSEGIAEVFAPGAKLDDIVHWVRENVKPRPT